MRCSATPIGVTGEKARARKILEEMTARSKRGYYPSLGIAVVQVGLGDKERVREFLGKAIDGKAQRET